MRLDIYLSTYFPELSRSQIQLLIKHGRAKVNGVPELKAGSKLGEDDVVELDTSPIENDRPDLSPDINIIYEDKNVVVIDKPAGLLTHSKGGFNPESTVASWLKSLNDFKFTENDNNRLGIVHRLDRSTSGVMICAKNQESLIHLQKLFQERKVEKKYIALVEGIPEPSEAVIDIPIERNPKQPQRFRAGAGGKTAQTKYKLIKKFSNYSLIELLPLTGRTHQLRVHLEHLKHPIIGDDFYHGKIADRLYLHAFSLTLTLMKGEKKVFKAELPMSFEDYK